MPLPDVRITSHYFNLNDAELLLLIDWFVDVEEAWMEPEHDQLFRRLVVEAHRRGLDVPSWADEHVLAVKDG